MVGAGVQDQVLRVMPPLVVSKDEVRQGVEIIAASV